MWIRALPTSIPELGVLIEDKALAKSFHNTFDNSMLNVSYRVHLTDDEQLIWQTHDDKTNKKLITLDKTAHDVCQWTLVKDFSAFAI